MGATSIVLICLFFLAVNIPCIVIAWLGSKYIGQLGRFPSKTAAIQMSLCLKLVVIEVASFTFILMLFKALSPDVETGV